MKKIILVTLLYFSCITAFSQKINGQWRGYFDSKGDIVLSGSGNTEFVLELEINGTQVSGFSYSYFQGRKYYVICKLKGVYYKSSKSIKVTETERVKGNTPPDFSDCLQVHFLTYAKEGNTEKLSGRWETAPGQRASCGDGNTTLTRRTLSKDLASFNKQRKASPVEVAKASTNTKKIQPQKQKTMPPAVVKNSTKTSITKPTVPAVKNTVKAKPVPAPAPIIAKMAPVPKEDSKLLPENKKPAITELKTDFNFEKRKADILKTIEIENDTFRIDLYDNGEVDGDSVSVFYNDKLILSHKRLSEKPITLTLDATINNTINELTMYAENLGEIPPNTALMVVTDGEKRYEVRISSDLKNSGTIHFIHKPKTQ